MSKLILSLDGGGIRGAATTQFLSRIDEVLQAEYQTTLRDCVDFYAGTSTGSLIALALATTSLSMAQINALYSPVNAQAIFTENRGFFEFDGINAPKYEGKGKTKIIGDNLGQVTMGQVAEGKHVLAMAYDVENRKPLVFKSTKEKHQALLAADIADASSAAPTYFPTKSLLLSVNNEQTWAIDGGVTANNPTMCAIAEACRVWPECGLSDTRVLSVGTGYRTRKINGPESQKWGALGWMTKGHIIDVLSDEHVVSYQAITITADGNYIRVNSEMRRQPGFESPPDDAMDDISQGNINKLKAMGDFWFDQYKDAVIPLLLGNYQGRSLDRINPITGKPQPYR